MKTTHWMGLALLEGMFIACTACAPPRGTRPSESDPNAHAFQTRTTTPRIDQEPGAPDVRSGDTAARFTPRTHPRHGALPLQNVNLSQLPRMSQQQCYPQSPQEYYAPGTSGGYAPRPMAQRRARSSTGYGGSVGGSGAAQAADQAAPKLEHAPGAAASPEGRAAPKKGSGQYSSEEAPPSPPRNDRAEAKRRAAEPERASGDKLGGPQAVPPPDDYHAWGAQIYLSNDDSMSLSSAQRIIHAIDNYLPLPQEYIRPHELLNYFSFDSADVHPDNDFSVVGSLDEKPEGGGAYTLGLSVSGRAVTRETRRNTALSLVLDRSGSMAQDERMSYLKKGLSVMVNELKTGDLVNLVLFDDDVCVPLSNFVVGRDSMDVLRSAINRIQPRGSTDLESGLRRGYELANLSHQPNFSNRVLLVTDALTNTGVTDPTVISSISEAYDRRQIRLSAIGVGREFNDQLLDQLTERGRGAYVFLGSADEVDAVFGNRFTSLIETIANEVHFKLSLPPSLRMNVFYGEESSTAKEEVQSIHYFAGTNQLFLSDVVTRDGILRTDDALMLTIEYKDPETDQARVEEYALDLGDLRQQSFNVKKGRLVMSFVDGLKDIAAHTPDSVRYAPGQWIDPDAAEQCARGKESLRAQRQALPSDREVDRIVALWDRFCARYPERTIEPAPRTPVRRPPPTGRDVWPSAQR
jgi:Ca-activated chloride channel homolog